MATEPIRGILFDIGGTLYSYRNLPATMATLLQEVAHRYEVEDVPALRRHFDLATRSVDQRIAERPFYLFRDYFGEIFAEFLERLGRGDAQLDFPWFEKEQRERIVACLEIKPDCHETLARLKAMGLYLAAASNADDDILEPLISRERLDRWLTDWTSSEQARSCKPDRRFFEIVLEKSGLAPREVMFVGDSLEQDILGANRAGLRTVHISDGKHAAPMHVGREVPEPDHRITSLGELPGLIEALGGGGDA